MASHPEKEQITRRYLKYQSSLYREALSRLAEAEEVTTTEEPSSNSQPEVDLEQSLSLNDQRHAAVLDELQASGARTVLDLGCGEGKLLRELLRERQFEKIVGMDVSIRSLELAQKRLKLDRLPDRQPLAYGSCMDR